MKDVISRRVTCNHCGDKHRAMYFIGNKAEAFIVCSKCRMEGMKILENAEKKPETIVGKVKSFFGRG